MFFHNEPKMVKKENALFGRQQCMPVANLHCILGKQISEPFPRHLSKAMFGLGCFWGAEKKFWELDGVFSTAVGYASGFTLNPNYKEVCSGLTGHNEVVLVIFDEEKIQYSDLLKCFWESHNPTQGMQQGNDVGTQYRSGIYTYSTRQRQMAEKSKALFQSVVAQAGHDIITSEIMAASDFYYAEDYHQQYLAKNSQGYCGLGGLGLAFHYSEER